MKYVKMLGLLAVAAAALMAFAGTASATVTSTGSVYDGEIHATSTNTSLDGSVKVSCGHSTVVGDVEHGTTTGPVTTLTFTECGKDTVSVLKTGTLSVSSTGTATSSGAEVTVQLHRTIIFPHINVTTHCIYKTNNTDVGTLTEGSSPVLHIGSAPIPEVETDGACGNDAVWTGSYTVLTPHELVVH